MTSLIISAGNVPAAANPSGLIGLSAVNGVAATWGRSDSTHAIDQSIAPTWTGLHTFNGGLTAKNVTVSTPASGTGFTVNMLDNTVGVLFHDTTSSVGLLTVYSDSVGQRGYIGTGGATWSGGNIADFGIACVSGTLRLGYGSGAATAIAVGSSGNITFNAPSSGQTLTMTGSAAGTAVIAISTAAQSGSGTITIALTDYPGTNVGAKTPKYIPILLDGSKYWIQALPD